MRQLYYAGQIIVYVTLLMPLVFHNGFLFPFITPRSFLFRVLMLLAAGVLAILWLNNKQLRPSKQAITFALLATVIAKVVSSAFGVHFYNSFWSNFERMEGLLTWLLLVVLYFLIITVIRTRTDWHRLLRFSLLPAIIIAGIGVAQYFESSWVLAARQSRIESLLGNAAYIGAYMVIHIGIAGYILARDKKHLWKYIAGASLLLFHVTLFFSATRGAILGWAVGLIVAGIFYQFYGTYKRVKRSIAILLIMLVVTFVGIWVQRDTTFVRETESLNRLTTFHLTESTIASRLHIWETARQGFLDKPIFGWGQDNFSYAYNTYYTEGIGEQWVDRAHNNTLGIFVTGGLVAGIPYIALLVLPLMVIWRTRHHDIMTSTIIGGTWIAYIVQNQFVFDSINTYLLFIFLLAFIAHLNIDAAADSEEQEAVEHFAQLTRSQNSIAGLVVVLGVAVLIWTTTAQAFLANTTFARGLERAPDDVVEGYLALQEAMARDSFGNKELALQFMQFTRSVVSSPDFTLEFKTDVVRTAILALEFVAQDDPEDARVLLSLAFLYGQAHSLNPVFIERGQAVMDQARQLSPGRLAVYSTSAQFALLAQNPEQALVYIGQAYRLNENNKETAINYLNVLQRIGEEAQVIDFAHEVEDRFADALTDLDEAVLISVYSQFESWEDVARLLEMALEREPARFEYWQLLGQAYQEMGDYSLVNWVDAQLELLDTATSTVTSTIDFSH